MKIMVMFAPGRHGKDHVHVANMTMNFMMKIMASFPAVRWF